MYQVRNYMEQAVLEKLDQVIDELQVCNCNKCRCDIIAMALNSLPPKYVVTNKGDMFARLAALERQFDINVITALVLAAEKVKNRPQHDEVV